MAQVLVRDLNTQVIEAIKRRARLNQRSTVEEIRIILGDAVQSDLAPLKLGTACRSLFTNIGLDEPLEELHFAAQPARFD